MKTCSKCALKKEITEFYNDKAERGGKRAECKECSKAYYHKRKSTYAPTRRKQHLRRKYGLTEESYQALLNKQNGCCGICGVNQNLGGKIKASNFCVDHCHITGKVRGLLCHTCNRSIGLMKDSKQTLLNAIHYLEENG